MDSWEEKTISMCTCEIVPSDLQNWHIVKNDLTSVYQGAWKTRQQNHLYDCFCGSILMSTWVWMCKHSSLHKEKNTIVLELEFMDLKLIFTIN